MKDYDNGTIRVRPSVKDDISPIADNLRESDRAEIWASNHIEPYEAIKKGFDKAIYCRTIENGSPIAMFGVCPQELLGQRATIWLLGTEDINKIKIKFLRHCKEYVSAMLEYYEYLENYVDVRNSQCIAWLKYLGAEFDKPEPYGVEGQMFQHFSFKRKK